jgi:hypothetical protein
MKKNAKKSAKDGLLMDIELTIKVAPDKDKGLNKTAVSTKGDNSLLEMLTTLKMAEKTLNSFIEQALKKNNVTTEKELKILLNTKINDFYLG